MRGLIEMGRTFSEGPRRLRGQPARRRSPLNPVNIGHFVLIFRDMKLQAATNTGLMSVKDPVRCKINVR